METRIGFLDSGIGGVTVLRECIKLLPEFEYIYYSDSINNPYGDKSKKEILCIVSNIVEYLISKGCYVIVIACNTASAMCVDELRKRYPNIFFVAIEPAIKLAYDVNNGGTLILTTKGTMDSNRFRELFTKYKRDDFYLKSCSGLANLIENDEFDNIYDYLIDNLSIYRGLVNSVVLGCTHYPLIKREISKVLGDVTFYDGSVGVAKRLKDIVCNNKFNISGDGKVLFVDSSNSIFRESRFKKLLKK